MNAVLICLTNGRSALNSSKLPRHTSCQTFLDSQGFGCVMATAIGRLEISLEALVLAIEVN
jgi:hypothetical protein